ncbi:MAG: hypothetical protein ABIJ45_03430, partial [Candidatus Zixiibacteriota bacterium]
MYLFDKNVIPLKGIKPRNCSVFEFLERSDRKGMQNIRKFWEIMYKQCRLSKVIKNEIRSRFISSKDPQHFSALFELFLYTFFRKLGYHVIGNPKLKNRKPDFKIINRNGANFYIEATCQFGSNKKSHTELWKDNIVDTINSIESQDFRVAVSFRGKLT